MKSIADRLVSFLHPASTLRRFDEATEAKWREKVRTIRESEAFIAVVSSQLPQEFGDYLRSLLMSGECPTDIPSLAGLVESKFSSSTTAFIHDCIAEEEWKSIQEISPGLLAALHSIGSGPNNSFKPNPLRGLAQNPTTLGGSA